MTSKKKTVPTLRFDSFNKEWQIARFQNELVESKLGGNYANSEKPTDYPLIKMGNLGRGNINLKKREYIHEDEKINPEDKIKEGDLFFNTRNTLDLVGKVAIWRSELPEAYYNSNLMRITFACNQFMNYRLNSFEGIKALRRLATGTTSVAAIYTRDLLKMKITLPPTLPEQRKIADFLTAVDGRIGQLFQKKALLEDYKKGVMQQLFTQALRFKDDQGKVFPDWEEKRLGDLCSTLKSGKGITAERITKTGDFPVFGGNGLRGYTDVFTHDCELVLIGRQGALCGNINRSRGKAYVSEHAIAVIENEKSMGEWLAQRLYHMKLNRLSESSAQPGLAVNKLARLKLDTPSVPEQTKIADFLSALDRKIEIVATQITETQTFKRGLLQQMFV